jgi:hypothetical protein
VALEQDRLGLDEERGYPTEYRAGLEDQPNEVVVTHGLYTDL